MTPEPKPSPSGGPDEIRVFLGIVVLAIAILFCFRLYVTTHRSLTPFEETVSDLFLLFLTFAFTWLLAKRDEERNVLAKQKALAKSALRRITGIGESAARLVGNLSQARKELKSDSFWNELDQPRRRLLLEILNGLGRQVLEMRGTIDASAEDWGEILPEELAKIKSAQQQILQQEQRALDAVASEVEHLEKLVRDGQLKADELKHLIEERSANIENKTRLEIERIRSEIRPFGLAGIGGLDVYSPSGSAAVMGLLASDLTGTDLLVKPGLGGFPAIGPGSSEPTDKKPK